MEARAMRAEQQVSELQRQLQEARANHEQADKQRQQLLNQIE